MLLTSVAMMTHKDDGGKKIHRGLNEAKSQQKQMLSNPARPEISNIESSEISAKAKQHHGTCL